MCGRYSLSSTPSRINAQFSVPVDAGLQPRYNIPPGTDILIVRSADASPNRTSELARWGFTPGWLQADKPGPRPINARAEGIESKPMFRNALRRRRCIVPANGFYEWKQLASGKQPWYISPRGDELFGFAGIVEPGNALTDGQATCAIITTRANALMQPIHDRMPVILKQALYDRWLDPTLMDSEAICAMLQPCNPDEMAAWPVSARVNSPRNDDESLTRPVDEMT